MPSLSEKIYGVILAGGSGTRLWPLSRSLLPKHLLALGCGETLLQQTILRIFCQIPPERIFTVTHESHLHEAKNQLHAIHPTLTKQILSEPTANNTLPAIAWGVTTIIQKDPEALVAVFPSDHLIQDKDAFHKDLLQAFEVAQQNYLVTLGIKPTGPETGYGYIQAGKCLAPSSAYTVSSFVEKPDRPTAEKYLQEGGYYWNSGIFVFRASEFLRELKLLEPSIHETMLKISSENNPSTLKSIYPTIKKISIDYGIMEKAEKVAVIPSSFGWNDLGSWEAIYKSGREPSVGSFVPFDRPDQVRSGQYSLTRDEEQNVIQGDVLALDTQSSLLISKKGLVTAIGLKDMVVVQTDDATLISPRNRVQEVKTLVDQLKNRKSPLTETHTTVYRPWGSYTILEEGLSGYKIKRIVVHPGQKLSLQSHRHRTEHWVVIEGTAKVTNGEKEFLLNKNESTYIPIGTKHRLENPGSAPLTLIEVQTGDYLGEDDIERVDDLYGRDTHPSPLTSILEKKESSHL